MEGNIKSIKTVYNCLLFLVSSAEKKESTTIKTSLISFLRNLLSIYKYLQKVKFTQYKKVLAKDWSLKIFLLTSQFLDILYMHKKSIFLNAQVYTYILLSLFVNLYYNQVPNLHLPNETVAGGELKQYQIKGRSQHRYQSYAV